MANNGERLKRIKKILNKFHKKLAKIESEERKLESKIQTEKETQEIENVQKKIKEL